MNFQKSAGKIAIIASLLFCVAVVSPAHGSEKFRVTVSSVAPLQGDVVVLSFFGRNLEARTARFDGEPIAFFPYRTSYRAIFGVPLTKPPGRYRVHIVFKNGGVFEKIIRVRARRVTRIALGIPKKLGLTPQNLVAELKTANDTLESILAVRTPTVFFNRAFGLPLSDNRKIGSRFGELRLSGGIEIRHLGVDFEAPLGTQVGAMNDGVVRKAYTDTIYGKSVVVDHGKGIFSLYLHMNEILVKEGEGVTKGHVIGTVGQTGYATAPHLHVSVKISNVAVDPLQLIARFH